MSKSFSILGAALLTAAVFLCFSNVFVTNTIAAESHGGVHTASCSEGENTHFDCWSSHFSIIIVSVLFSIAGAVFYLAPSIFLKKRFDYKAPLTSQIQKQNEHISYLVQAFRRGILNPKTF